RHACAADPRAHHRRAGDLRRHSFRAAAGRAGHLLRRRTGIRAGAGACGGRRRRGRDLHRDPPGPRSSAVRRTQYGAAPADGGAAAAPSRIRPTREELKINGWKLSEFDHPARPQNRRPRGFRANAVHARSRSRHPHDRGRSRHRRENRCTAFERLHISLRTDPRAKVCFTSVFFEAVFIHGLFPYVALLLLAIGETRASIAGLLIATFALGGVFYSLSVPMLISRVREQHLMVAGGTLAATALILIALFLPWMWQIVIYALFGFGFYLLHSCIQVHVTELSQTARGAAASLHSSFFLSWPSGGSGGLWLWFCPRPAPATHFPLRCG